eukprot:tig00020710_g13393.t1
MPAWVACALRLGRSWSPPLLGSYGRLPAPLTFARPLHIEPVLAAEERSPAPPRRRRDRPAEGPAGRGEGVARSRRDPSAASRPFARSRAPARTPRPAPAGRGLLIAFCKPYDVVSQFTTPSNATNERMRTLSDFDLPPGVYPVGRLDSDSEGLLLLSDDRAFIDRYLDPRRGHPRTYTVQVEGLVEGDDDERLAALRAGGEVGARLGRVRPCLARLLDPAVEASFWPREPPVRFRKAIPTSWLELTLTEGKNRARPLKH